MSIPSEPVLACSLSAQEAAERAAEMRGVPRRALIWAERQPGEACFGFRATPEVESAVYSLVAREKRCCPFLDFDLHRDGQVLTLGITGPSQAQEVLDAIAGQLALSG